MKISFLLMAAALFVTGCASTKKHETDRSYASIEENDRSSIEKLETISTQNNRAIAVKRIDKGGLVGVCEIRDDGKVEFRTNSTENDTKKTVKPLKSYTLEQIKKWREIMGDQDAELVTQLDSDDTSYTYTFFNYNSFTQVNKSSTFYAVRKNGKVYSKTNVKSTDMDMIKGGIDEICR